MTVFSKEMEAFIRERLKGVDNREGTELINQTFGTDVKVSQLKAWRKNHKCPNGRDTRFPKGHPSPTKGKTWEELGIPMEKQESMRTTCYKKGNKPSNAVALGTEKVRDDGYLYVKVSDGNGMRNWVQKHRLIWEKANGPIPEGMYIFFKDGDRGNCNLDNLAIVGAEEKKLAQTVQLSGMEELWEPLARLSFLNRRIGEIENGRQDKE